MKLTGVLVDVINQEIKVVTIPGKNRLKEYYDILKCDTIDIVSYNIKGKKYDIIVDDEGLFKENNPPAIALIYAGELTGYLVGNAFIVKHDGKGKEISLTKSEIDDILSMVIEIPDKELGTLKFICAEEL